MNDGLVLILCLSQMWAGVTLGYAGPLPSSSTGAAPSSSILNSGRDYLLPMANTLFFRYFPTYRDYVLTYLNVTDMSVHHPLLVGTANPAFQYERISPAYLALLDTLAYEHTSDERYLQEARWLVEGLREKGMNVNGSLEPYTQSAFAYWFYIDVVFWMTQQKLNEYGYGNYDVVNFTDFAISQANVNNTDYLGWFTIWNQKNESQHDNGQTIDDWSRVFFLLSYLTDAGVKNYTSQLNRLKNYTFLGQRPCKNFRYGINGTDLDSPYTVSDTVGFLLGEHYYPSLLTTEEMTQLINTNGNGIAENPYLPADDGLNTNLGLASVYALANHLGLSVVPRLRASMALTIEFLRINDIEMFTQLQELAEKMFGVADFLLALGITRVENEAYDNLIQGLSWTENFKRLTTEDVDYNRSSAYLSQDYLYADLDLTVYGALLGGPFTSVTYETENKRYIAVTPIVWGTTATFKHYIGGWRTNLTLSQWGNIPQTKRIQKEFSYSGNAQYYVYVQNGTRFNMDSWTNDSVYKLSEFFIVWETTHGFVKVFKISDSNHRLWYWKNTSTATMIFNSSLSVEMWRYTIEARVNPTNTELIQEILSDVAGSNVFSHSFKLSLNGVSTPFTPSQVKVLVVSRTNYQGSGYLLSDLARYGFNTTWVSSDSAGTSVDWLNDSRTKNINRYDVVILHSDLTTSPASNPIVGMSQAEVSHFTKTFDGVLVVTNNAMFRNETSADWYGWTSTPMVNIETRLGIDFTGWLSGGTIYNGTFYRMSTLISGTPSSIPFFHTTGGGFYKTAISLNGATQLYNFTATASGVGITYYKNASGSVGIYLNGVWVVESNAGADTPQYWGLFSSGSSSGYGLDSSRIQSRSELLGRLIAYALDEDYNTIIKPQPMAVIRVDDYASGSAGSYYSYDYNQSTSLQNLYNALQSYNIAGASLAFLVNSLEYYPLTIQKAKDLNLQSNGWSLETHFRHEDYRAYSVAQVETLIDNSYSDYSTYGFRKFSVGVAPAGYFADNVFTAMANKGMYLLDLTSALLPSGMDWWDTRVNSTVLMKTAPNMGTAVKFNDTRGNKDAIHYGYFSQRAGFALAIFNGAPTFYFHSPQSATNEVGPWIVRTLYQNLTAEVPDVEFVTNQVFAQYFAKKWATLTNPIRTGNTITFNVNTDSIPTLATIGKGSLWYRVVTNPSNIIASVKINGSDWYAFDDFTIRIPAANSVVEVTLGTPAAPHLIESDKQIMTTNYSGNTFSFSISASTGQTSTTRIYVGNEGPPEEILIRNGTLSWNYESSTKIITVDIVHNGTASVLMDWRARGDVNGDNIIDVVDISCISAHWYPGPPFGPLEYNMIADINHDGAVDILDVGIVSAYWTGPPKGPMVP